MKATKVMYIIMAMFWQIVGFLIVLSLFECTSLIAANYGIGREQLMIHNALFLGFFVGLLTLYIGLYRPCKRNLDAADKMLKFQQKLLDAREKGDADWWKDN